MGCTCLAIAQTKPANSRAIAAVTTVSGLPTRANLRYRWHSRSCAFHAVSRTTFLPQQLLATDPCRERIAPGGLDKHPPCRAVASLCYTALAPRVDAGVLGRHQTEIGHELAWIGEARDGVHHRGERPVR